MSVERRGRLTSECAAAKSIAKLVLLTLNQIHLEVGDTWLRIKKPCLISYCRCLDSTRCCAIVVLIVWLDVELMMQIFGERQSRKGFQGKEKRRLLWHPILTSPFDASSPDLGVI